VVGSRRREVDVAALVNDDLKGNYMKLALLVCAAALSLVPSGRCAAGGSETILTGLFSALAGLPEERHFAIVRKSAKPLHSRRV
jgi:hypothetical protein